MYRPFSVLVAIAAITASSCTIRPTGDGGIAVAPMQDTPVSVKALVTQPEPTAPAAAPAPAGQCSTATIAYGEWLAAQVTGSKEGSRVNVRPQPSLTAVSGSYALVGDAIAVMGEAVGPDCKKWFHVQFPKTGFQGWVFADFVKVKE